MTAAQLVKAFLERLVQLEVERLLPQAAKLVPGLPGQLASSLLQSPVVQAELVKLETAGVDAAVDFLARELEVAKAWVLRHVSGQWRPLVEAAFNVNPPPSLHLSAEQVRELAVLAAAGRLDAAIQQALADVAKAA